MRAETWIYLFLRSIGGKKGREAGKREKSVKTRQLAKKEAAASGVGSKSRPREDRVLR